MRPPSARDRLIEAMALSCASQGYAETTTEQLCEAAGASREEFEQLFGSREECAVAAVKAILGETMSAVGASYSADRSEWDSGLLGIRAILELMAANPSPAYVAYIASRQMTPAGVREVREAGVSLLCTMLDRLRTYSAPGEQPSQAAVGAFGSAEALVRREIVAGRTDQLPRLLPDLVYGATVPFLGQEEALRLTRRARELLAGSRWA